MEARAKSIIAMTAAADLSGKRGYLVERDGNGKAAIVNSATDIPLAVILDGGEGADTQASVAVPGGGVGPCKVKLNGTPGTIVVGTRLALCADGTVKADPGTGARVLVAVALEAGAANELIEAVLIEPLSIAAASVVALGNANGEIAGLTFSTTPTQAEAEALRDKAEELADDVRAIYAALVSRGILSAS